MSSNNHILILDDDPDILSFLKHELKKSGFEIDEATNADLALSLLQKNKYLCAIVDIVLGPNVTSEKVIQFFKKGSEEIARKTPLIITSAFMKADYAQKIEAKGINVYRAIPKPFKPGQFTKILKQLQNDLKSGLFTPIDPKLFEMDENDPELDDDTKENLHEIDDRLVHVQDVKEQHKINSAVMAQEDINYRNEEGETSLMIFAAKGRLDLVENLLKIGADPNLKSKAGKTAMHFAIRSNNIEMLATLVAHGGKVSVRDEKNHEPLFDAILNGNYGIVDYLISQGSRIDVKVDGKTYLFWAIEKDNLPVFNRLLAAGLDPKIKNSQGKDIKQMARELDKKPFLKIISTLNL